MADEAPIQPEMVELGRPVEFERDIYPILQANCVACHNKAKSEGDLNLEEAATALKGSASGQVIVPGKPDESYLYNVAAQIEESYMPPMPNEVQAQKLTPQQLGLLRQWILEGAKAGSTSGSAAMNWQSISEQLKAIYAVDVGPWGQYVAAGRAGNVSIYDVVRRNLVSTLKDPALHELNSAQQQTHRDYVHAIAIDPTGNRIATAGYQIVKLWDRTTAIEPASIEGTVSQLDSSNQVAAAVSSDGIVHLLKPGEQQASAKVPLNETTGQRLLGVHGDSGQQISVATDANLVRLIQTTDSAVVGASEALPAPPAEVLSLPGGTRFVVRLEDGSVHLLVINAEAGQLKLEPAPTLNAADSKATEIHGDGTLLAVVQNQQKVSVHNAESLAAVATIDVGQPIRQVAISAVDQRIVTVNEAGVTQLWNSADGKKIADLNQDLLASRAHATQVQHKAVRDARVTVVKGQVTEDEKRLKEQQDALTKANEAVEKAKAALTEAEKKVTEAKAALDAANTELQAKADDAALKKKVEEATKAHQTAVDAVTAAKATLTSSEKGVELSKQAVARAEQRVTDRKAVLATVEAEAKTSAEQTTAAEAVTKQPLHSQHVAIADGFGVVSVTADGHIRIWQIADGKPLDVLPQVKLEAVAAIVDAGTNLLVQSAEGGLQQIDLQPRWKLSGTLGAAEQGGASPFADRILALAWSPDGTLLATGGGEASRSGELMIWNATDRTLVHNVEDAHSDTVYGVEFSRDGKRLASAAADKFVKVFDVATGEHVRSFEGHTHHVMDVSWKGDGTQLVSAGADNAMKVWNVETGEQIRTISTYQKQVTALNFVGMTDEFISCSGDRRVFRHRASNGGTVREFKGSPDYVYSSATTSDGALVAAGGEDGVLRVWDGTNAKEIVSFAP
ncbi:MAG: vegetatible incompatibility protein HET-E1 [Fuerstiella sp.]